MRIEQTLHGYDDGHRQLASSIKLAPDEERALDLLSDLSGYIPAGTDFESYDTGYPCGRFYVLARTWLDRAGRRGGTVFTHSLLLPRNEVGELSTLTALDALYMKPSHPVDREAYRRWVSLLPFTSGEPWLPSATRQLLAALWFGQDARPLLWAAPENAASTAIVLWSWLPPWLRADHTFCTLALQPRYLGPKLFDFLAIASGAEGLFYSIRDRAVLCDSRTVPAGAGPLLQFPWVAEIADGPPGAAQALWTDAVARGFSRLPSTDLRVFLRYRELRARAEISFTAALSCLDLLKRLAPDSTAGADEKSDLMWLCLRHARGADPQTRTLLHALDILERDPRNFAPALAPEIGAYLAETLEACAARQADLAARVWPLASRAGFKAPARDGILEALRSAGATLDADTWLTRVGALAAVLLDDAPTALQVVLQTAPHGAGARLIALWLARVPEAAGPSALDAVLDAASARGDLALITPAIALLPTPTLLDTVDRILGRTSPTDLDSARQLVAGASVEGIADWLGARAPELVLAADFASVLAGRLADETAVSAFFDRVTPSAAAVRVLAACTERSSAGAASAILRSRPRLLASVVVLAQADPLGPGIRALMSDGMEGVEVTMFAPLFDLDPASIARWERAPWAQPLIQRVVPTVLTEYLGSGGDIAMLRAWFASSPCQAWLRAGVPWPIEKILMDARGETAVRAVEVVAEPAMLRLPDRVHLVRACLEAWGGQPAVAIAPLVPSWVALVKSLTHSELRATACSISLRTALDKPDAALAPLAEVGFATSHRQLLKDATHGHIVARFFAALFGADWDKAKHLRDALARTWIDHSWPPLTLLRAADGDADLFRQLASRAIEHSGGKKALRRLREAARADSAAEPRWARMLAELPGSVREG